MEKIYTVSEFNTQADNFLANTFSSISVQGEVSECKNSKIGAIYFSLCDADSSVSCVIFKNQYSQLGFELTEGMKVVVVGDAGIYKKRGSFQLVARSIKRDGKGSIIEKILKNAEEWKDTYFAREKREIPKGIKNLFVVTSATGDVIHDIIRTRNLRDKSVNIFIFPCLVQGAGCAESVSYMVNYANAIMAKMVQNPTLNENYGFSYDNTALIVARGGGSFDDLLPFNDEVIVKSFSQSKLIIVSAIGHDQNRPLCNYAADRYVSTPTQAAEVCVFDVESEKRHFLSLMSTLVHNVTRLLQYNLQNFDNLKQLLDVSLENISAKVNSKIQLLNNRLSSSLEQKLKDEIQKLKDCRQTISLSVNQKYIDECTRAEHLTKMLEHISPKNVMKRGYSVIQDKSGATIGSASKLKTGDLEVVFYDGKVNAHLEVK